MRVEANVLFLPQLNSQKMAPSTSREVNNRHILNLKNKIRQKFMITEWYIFADYIGINVFQFSSGSNFRKTWLLPPISSTGLLHSDSRSANKQEDRIIKIIRNCGSKTYHQPQMSWFEKKDPFLLILRCLTPKHLYQEQNTGLWMCILTLFVDVLIEKSKHEKILGKN